MSKRPRVDTPTALTLLGPARATREKTHADGTVFAPTVVFAPRRGQPMIAILAGEGQLPLQLATLLEQMRTQLGPAEWIAVTTDIYTKSAADGESVVPGSLEAAFLAGDPTVSEQMMVVLRHRYKPAEVAVQTYRHLPSEGFEWDEPELMESHGDAIAEVLNYYF